VSLLTSLAAYYKFDGSMADSAGGAGGTFTSPGSNTPSGAPANAYVTGKIGQGVRGQVQVANFTLGSQWSVSFWVNNPNQAALPIYGPTGTYAAQLINYAVFGTSAGIYWEQASPGGNSRFGFYDGVANAGSWFTAPAAFVHFVITYNAGTVQFWKDGVLDQTFTGRTNPGPHFNAVNQGYAGFLQQNGSLDELGFWNRPLTGSEIARLYNSGNALSHPFPDAPTIVSVSPAAGPRETAVTITGTGFVSGATVAFDGIPATSVVFVSATSITCVTPAHAAGAVNVVVRNPDLQTGTAINAFTYSAGLPSSSAGSRLLDLLPPGRLWELEAGSTLHRLMVGVGDEVDRVITRARDLFEETDPRTAIETIGDWERVLALPDEQVIAIPATLAQRRVAVTQKLVGRTGQNLSFFTALCAACGYPVNQIERFATSMLRVNGRVGARVYGEAWAYTMRITLNAPTAGALSVADFERVVRHATHAHIVVVFTYL
jgi:uncharacterized protein YmfQ (DUF2313 family)